MRSLFLLLCCLGGLSFLECRAVGLIQGANAPAQVDVVRGIVTGHPYWKAYQNRLLGPEIVWWASRLTGAGLESCYLAFGFIAVLLANTLCFCLFLKHGKNPTGAWLYTLAYAGLFVALQDAQWLYLWDYLDLSTMLLFAWFAVLGNRPTWQFAALFAVQLLNRESAAFIALWLVIDAVRIDRWAPAASRFKFAPARFWVGIILGAAGAVWTNLVRNALCVQETGVVPRPEVHETASGQFLMLRVSFDLLREPPTVTSVTVLLLLAAAAGLLWRAWYPLGSRAWKVCLILSALVAANFCVAFIFELRVWFILLPWLLCLTYVGQVRGRDGLPVVTID